MSPASLAGLPWLAVSGEEQALLHFQALFGGAEVVVSWRERSQDGDATLPRPIYPVFNFRIEQGSAGVGDLTGAVLTLVTFET